MVREIAWSEDAIADLVEIRDYISSHSPANAEAVIRAIEIAADNLNILPMAQRMVPEVQDPGRRETFVHRWRNIYRVFPDKVRIVGVIHGARLLSNLEGRSFEEGPQAEYITS